MLLIRGTPERLPRIADPRVASTEPMLCSIEAPAQVDSHSERPHERCVDLVIDLAAGTEHTCADETDFPGACTVLACADIASRAADYASAASLPGLQADAGVQMDASMQPGPGVQVEVQARSYLDFLESKYRTEGVLWNAYTFAGQSFVPPAPAVPNASLAGYVFFAKLAMSFGLWDLAEKIFVEQILPNQVFPSNGHPSNGTYPPGAFKPRLAAVTSCWDDAQELPNLEAVTALHIWNAAQKGGWTSTYPKWTTVYSVIGGTGGRQTVTFPDIETQYVRLLLKKRGSQWGNYSLYEIQASGPDGSCAISNASVSSVQWDQPAGRPWTANLAIDGDTTRSRWSSSQDGSDPQWIYVDFGARKKVSTLVIYWETAYAVDFDVQRADIP